MYLEWILGLLCPCMFAFFCVFITLNILRVFIVNLNSTSNLKAVHELMQFKGYGTHVHMW